MHHEANPMEVVNDHPISRWSITCGFAQNAICSTRWLGARLKPVKISPRPAIFVIPGVG